MRIEPKAKSDRYDPRFVIVDDDGKVIDNAQGYGYKSKQKAAKAIWYKFKGGKEKLNQQEEDKISFFKKHKGVNEFLRIIWENNFKEIAIGEVTDQDIVDDVKKEFGIDIPKEYVSGMEE